MSPAKSGPPASSAPAASAPASSTGGRPTALRVTSFDVFDTVLTRTVGDPAVVFRLTAQRLPAPVHDRVDTGALVTARARAEQELTVGRGRPPTLQEVHDDVARRLGLTTEDAGTLHRTELEVERAVCRAVPGALDLLTRARGHGPVVFVSDTPHTGPFVQELLGRAGLWQDGDQVFSSADRGSSKSHGGALFDVVAQALGVDRAGLVHIGDNAYADTGEARLHGWGALSRPQARLNRYERILEADAVATAGLSSHLAGASRLGRLGAVEAGVPDAVASVTTGVAAPMLVGYGLWVLAQARQRGLRRLYFASRDGQVMRDVTAALAAATGQEVECRYLHCSRRAWRLATLVDADGRLRGTPVVGDVDKPRTTRQVLHRAGLDLDALAPGLLPALPVASADELLEPGMQRELDSALTTGPLGEAVRRTAQDARALLLDYLDQEGVGEGPSSALVDVGWSAGMSRHLDDVMHETGRTPLAAVLNLGLLAPVRVNAGERLRPRLAGWLFDRDAGHGLATPLSGEVPLVELFCTATHGSVRGYRRQGDRIEPDMIRTQNTPALQWGLEGLRSALMLAVRELIDSGCDLTGAADTRPVVLRLLREFWERPTVPEARAWGSLPFEYDDTHLATIPLAEAVTARQVWASARRGRVQLRPQTSWRAGTAVLSSPPWRQAVQAKARLDEISPRARRVPHRIRVELARRGHLGG